MSYTPSPFSIGDLVETTEEYRQLKKAYEKEIGYHVTTRAKGFVKKVIVCHHKDTGLPMFDYIILDNGFGSKVEHFKRVV